MRIAIGIYLISSGIMGGGVLGVVSPFDSDTMTATVIPFEIYAAIQISLGILLITGLFVRISSVLVIGLVVSAFTVYGLNALDQIMVLGVSIALLLKGNSKYSLDNLLIRKINFGWLIKRHYTLPTRVQNN